MDVTDTDSVAHLAEDLWSRHGGVHIVISNAVARLVPGESQAARADEFIDVSNSAAHAVLRSFGPVLRPRGLLIVVASSLGTLGHLDPRLHHLLDGASLDQVEYAVESWRSAVHHGTAEEAGRPRWLNVPSKVAQVAAVRAVAAERREHDLADGTLIASVCPGMVDTATSRPWFSDHSGARPPAEAVLDLVLANHVDPALYGELVRFGKVLPWHDGTPRWNRTGSSRPDVRPSHSHQHTARSSPMNALTTPFGFSSTAAEVADGIDLSGRRAVVTGASSGLGAETARALAGTGAAVTLAVRDVEAGERAAEDIAGSTGNQEVHVAHLDLTDLASVTAFTTAWQGPLAHPGEQRRRHGLSRAVHRTGPGVAVRHQPPRPLRPLPRPAPRPGRRRRRAHRRREFHGPPAVPDRLGRRRLRLPPVRPLARLRPVQDRQRPLRGGGEPPLGRGRHHRQRPDARRHLHLSEELLAHAG